MKLSKIIILIIGAICISCSKYDTLSLEGTLWVFEGTEEGKEEALNYQNLKHEFIPVTVNIYSEIRFKSKETLTMYWCSRINYDKSKYEIRHSIYNRSGGGKYNYYFHKKKMYVIDPKSPEPMIFIIEGDRMWQEGSEGYLIKQ